MMGPTPRPVVTARIEAMNSTLTGTNAINERPTVVFTVTSEKRRAPSRHFNQVIEEGHNVFPQEVVDGDNCHEGHREDPDQERR